MNSAQHQQTKVGGRWFILSRVFARLQQYPHRYFWNKSLATQFVDTVWSVIPLFHHTSFRRVSNVLVSGVNPSKNP